MMVCVLRLMLWLSDLLPILVPEIGDTDGGFSQPEPVDRMFLLFFKCKLF
jgi:hypothetical protein